MTLSGSEQEVSTPRAAAFTGRTLSSVGRTYRADALQGRTHSQDGRTHQAAALTGRNHSQDGRTPRAGHTRRLTTTSQKGESAKLYIEDTTITFQYI